MCADGGCQNSTGNHRWLECDKIHQQPWWPATFSTKFHNFEGLGEIILHILKGWSLRTRGQLVENPRVPYNPLGQELILGLEEIEGFSPSIVWVGKRARLSWMANLVCLRPRNQRVQRCLWDALGYSCSPGRTCPNQHGHRILLNGKTELSIRTVHTERLICSRVVRLCAHKRINDSYEPYGSSTNPKVF